MSILNTTPEIDALIAERAEAKANEAAWAEIRKEKEKLIAEAYDGFAEIMDSLDQKSSLTTTVNIGDHLKVTLGYSMNATQPAIMDFLSQFPMMNGILFRQEFKPDARAVLKTIDSGSEVGKALTDGVITFKEKNPSFSNA